MLYAATLYLLCYIPPKKSHEKTNKDIFFSMANASVLSCSYQQTFIDKLSARAPSVETCHVTQMKWRISEGIFLACDIPTGPAVQTDECELNS